MAVVETRRQVYEQIVESVDKLVENADPATAASLQRQAEELKESWDQVVSRANEEQERLEGALDNAKELEEKMNAIDQWLTKVEADIIAFEEPSTILEKLQKQRVSYKVDKSCCLMIISKFLNAL